MSLVRVLVFVVAWLTVLMTAGSAQVPGGRGGAPAGQADSPLTVPTEVLLGIQGGGDVPVILRARTATAFRPEGLLIAAETAAQRSEIARAQGDVVALLTARGLPSSRFDTIPFVSARINANALAALQASGLVDSIEEDQLLRPFLAESVPRIGADKVWANGYNGSGWTVAVLDSGVDKGHPFLSGKVVSEACYSKANGIGSGTTLCPDGSTFTIATGSGVPCSGTGCDHGTHVAGIVAGNGSSFSGVARGASLIAIQVFTRLSDGSLTAYNSDVIRGLERAYALRSTYNIAAVNISLGGALFTSTSACDTANSSTKSIIDNLRTAGTAAVIASGNNGSSNSISTPGCISSAISVASTNDTTDAVSSFSNTASFLSLLAPGSVITSSVLNGAFGAKQGTSMAAPHVAGAWAVLRQINPGATVSTVLNTLQNTGVAVTDPDNGLRFRRIAVAAAAAASPCTYSVSTASASVDAVATNVTLTVTAPVGCSWTSTSNDAWIAVTQGHTGAGTGTVTFAVDKNTSIARTGSLVVAGFSVSVTQAALFVDQTLTEGLTMIRAVHLTDLRRRIDTVRASYNLSPVTWIDPTITPGVTVVRAVHVTQLRSALSEAYVAAGRSPLPVFSDTLSAGGLVVIRALHIRELRNAVIDIW